jgi:dTDP-4-amino-4,6-dideoxygalactose transaminase
MNKTLHVGQPNIGNQEVFIERVRDALDRRWLSNNGPYVQMLEKKVCELLDVEHCVAVANATLGLQLVAACLGDYGRTVIMPSFTFIATPHAVLWEGMEPVFAEVDPKTHCLDPEDVERMITSRTCAICGVHVWGNACDVEALQMIADKHGIYLYYDAAHAFACQMPNGSYIGGFGNAEVFSFHATKFFQSLEGGAITTNDGHLASRLRMLRNFGYYGDGSPPQMLGINAKMNEICAAMALTNLESLDTFILVNRRNYELYRKGLPETVKLYCPQYKAGWNHQYVVIEHPRADDLAKALKAERILARRYCSPPCHQCEPYCHGHGLLPFTEQLAAKTLCLPTGMNVSEGDVGRVCAVIKEALRAQD